MAVKSMDPNEKKRIANEKRLKAVKQWKKNQTVINVQPRNTHVIFNTNEEKCKPKLFGSEDEFDDFEDAFKIRPQFEGLQGKELLEMSSQFSGRFKLDERFCEDEPEPKESQNSEKEKNIKILQSVLGFGVSSKSTEKSSKKRQIRFDPEDENALKYIKNLEDSESHVPKKKKKKEKKLENDNLVPNIPISTERYIEVSSNLKTILNETAAPFSLSQKFDEFIGLETSESKKINGIGSVEDYEMQCDQLNDSKDTLAEPKITDSDSRYIVRKVQKDSFFIKEGDARLQEGIEFFQRPESMDQIRDEWNRRKEYVAELFRRKLRSGVQSYSSKNRSLPFNNSRRQKF